MEGRATRAHDRRHEDPTGEAMPATLFASTPSPVDFPPRLHTQTAACQSFCLGRTVTFVVDPVMIINADSPHGHNLL